MTQNKLLIRWGHLVAVIINTAAMVEVRSLTQQTAVHIKRVTSIQWRVILSY